MKYCPKIDAFKEYYVCKQELVYLAYGDIVDCGKGVRLNKFKIQCSTSVVVIAQKLTRVLFYKKTALIYFKKIKAVF